MKFKVPEKIGRRAMFEVDGEPCCVIGHLAHQIGVRDYQPDRICEAVHTLFPELNIWEVTLLNDGMRLNKQRQKLFARIVKEGGYELED
jgi:hypothetical protein